MLGGGAYSPGAGRTALCNGRNGRTVSTSLNIIYVEFDYYFSYFISNIYNLKMCWYVSFVYNFYQELKDKETLNRLNSKKEDYYILDFYGDIIFLK